MEINGSQPPFILATVSGKGGVGKSLASVNLAGTLGKMGYRTALIDADIGLSNCATMLNEPAGADVGDWLQNRCPFEELFQQAGNLTLVTGSDNPDQGRLSPDRLLDGLDEVVRTLRAGTDFILIDTPAGASDITFWALDSANIGLLVLVDEPTSLSDLYRLCKYVWSIDPEYPFSTLVNRAESAEGAAQTFQRFNTILDYFHGKKSGWLGYLPESGRVREAIRHQIPLFQQDNAGVAETELQSMAQHLIGLRRRELGQAHTGGPPERPVPARGRI